jgi:PTS system mannose-specific IIA component
MIGMVLVTHGCLATEFRAALEHVVGPQEQLQTVTIGPEDDMEARRKDIIAAVAAVETGDGVVVLTDMFGATPSNVAQKLVDGVHSRLVAGLNLPMLLRAVSYRHEPLDTLVARALAGASQGVMQVAITAPQNQHKRHHDQDLHDHQQ